MPISSGKYVSPTWVNDAAPAIDATELQAITDTVESNQVGASTVTLSATWSGSNPYTQTVSVTGATENSKIDLQPTAAQIQQLIDDGVSALYIENNAGTLTAYAVGAPTSVSMTVQCTLTEVST